MTTVEHERQPSVVIRLDPANPGQFLACCGLFELANRLWQGAEAWFESNSREFYLAPTNGKVDASAPTLLRALAEARVDNTMKPEELARREALPALLKQSKSDPKLEAEKKKLDSLWRESPVVLGPPFNLMLNWFADDPGRGATFKTWAGQQSVIDIARGMQRAMVKEGWFDAPIHDWLSRGAIIGALPFNFDSDLGGSGSARDVGFAFDPLKRIRVQARPLLELCAFIGLQRCRPIRVGRENRYRYATWNERLPLSVASAVTCALVPAVAAQRFEFGLLYRTQYLKSFLPAQTERRDP